MAKNYTSAFLIDLILEDTESLLELYKYCSPDSILVVTWYGKLKELFCPFRVKVNKDVIGLKKGEYTYVEKVLMTTNGSVVFQVKGLYYRYSHFDILANL